MRRWSWLLLPFACLCAGGCHTLNLTVRAETRAAKSVPTSPSQTPLRLVDVTSVLPVKWPSDRTAKRPTIHASGHVIRRVMCRRCGVTTELVPWADPGSGGFTRDFEDRVAYLTQRADKTTVSNLMRIAWETVGRIAAWVATRIGPWRYSGFSPAKGVMLTTPSTPCRPPSAASEQIALNRCAPTSGEA